MRWIGIGAGAVALGIIQGGAQACTLGSDVFRETQEWEPAVTALAVAEALTGKGWNELEEETRRRVVGAIRESDAPTHAATSSGVEIIEKLLTGSSIPAGVYRVDVGGEEHGLVEVRVGKQTFWIEESWGCYARYGEDILVWNGYGGEICSEDEYDPDYESC